MIDLHKYWHPTFTLLSSQSRPRIVFTSPSLHTAYAGAGPRHFYHQQDYTKQLCSPWVPEYLYKNRPGNRQPCLVSIRASQSSLYIVQPFYDQGPPLPPGLPTPPPTLHARYLQNCAKMTVLPAAVCRGGGCQHPGPREESI